MAKLRIPGFHINEEDGETSGSDLGALCPYCHKINEIEGNEIHFYRDGDDHECVHCEEIFELVTDISIEYTAKKKETT